MIKLINNIEFIDRYYTRLMSMVTINTSKGQYPDQCFIVDVEEHEQTWRIYCRRGS